MISDEKLFRVAVAYYANGKRQKEIARELGVSHVQVGKYLKTAQNRGIVEITINPPTLSKEEQDKYKKLLNEIFGLENLVLVAGASSEDRAYSFLIERAVKYIIQTFRNERLNIGFGLGRTVLEMSQTRVKTAEKKTNWSYYPILNYDIPLQNSHDEGSYFRYSAASENFVNSWGGSIDKKCKNILDLSCEKSKFRETTEGFWNNLDLVIGGVGIPFTRVPAARKVMFGEEHANVDISGDYLNYFFDDKGNIYPPLSHGKYMIKLEQLRRVPYRIAVASGFQKVGSIIGLLKCNLVNTLITDLKTVNSIISESLT